MAKSLPLATSTTVPPWSDEDYWGVPSDEEYCGFPSEAQSPRQTLAEERADATEGHQEQADATEGDHEAGVNHTNGLRDHLEREFVSADLAKVRDGKKPHVPGVSAARAKAVASRFVADVKRIATTAKEVLDLTQAIIAYLHTPRGSELERYLIEFREAGWGGHENVVDLVNGLRVHLVRRFAAAARARLAAEGKPYVPRIGKARAEEAARGFVEDVKRFARTRQGALDFIELAIKYLHTPPQGELETHLSSVLCRGCGKRYWTCNHLEFRVGRCGLDRSKFHRCERDGCKYHGHAVCLLHEPNLPQTPTPTR